MSPFLSLCAGVPIEAYILSCKWLIKSEEGGGISGRMKLSLSMIVLSDGLYMALIRVP
jgi:hypothetical protein